ncbi:MAG: hypothetical protein N2596_06730, partial [Syntrophorhabdaceae bacterium]|nr:hypothetical protein [Syntrophorhabdaceae bacterium]
MFLKNTFHESLSIIFLFICILLPSCATVSVYNIDLKYEPTKQATKPHVAPDRILFTITEFKDLRKTDNEIIIGKVVDTKGKEIPIASLTQRPAQAIPKAFKDALLRVGF